MKSIFRLAAAAALLTLPGTARADGWRIASPLDAAKSGFSLDVEGGQQWQELPKWQFGNHPGTATPFYATTPTADGGQGGAALGFRPSQGWLGWGRNERIEISGGIFDLDDYNHQNFPSPNANDLWNPVGGALGGLGLITGGVDSAELRTHYYGGELALRAATDLELTQRVTLTPAVAVFGGMSHLAQDYADNEACFFGFCFNDTVNERVQSQYVGLMLSAGSRTTLSGGFSLLAGAGAGLVGKHSTLRAADCFDDNQFLAGCQPDALTADHATNATRTRDDAGARLSGQLGLRYQVGPATVDLLGNLRFDSAVPAVRNPISGAQTVQLGSASEIGYGIALRASFPLGPAR